MKQFYILLLIGAVCCYGSKKGNVPYHISIEKFGNHVCSGAIISNDIMITTASCLYEVQPSDIKVRVGTDQLETDGSVKAVRKITPHKRYMTTRKDYDIALIQLDEKLIYSDKIQPIALTPNSSNPPKQGTHGYLTGYGLNDGDDHYSEELQQEDMQISVPITCKNAYAPMFIYITERMFCAELSIKHSCHRDSGSLLVINNELVGIQAWEHKCGSSKFPGIYTNIANLRRWIKNEVDL